MNYGKTGSDLNKNVYTVLHILCQSMKTAVNELKQLILENKYEPF